MEENITVSITNCSFVLTDENKTAVVIQDNPEGEFKRAGGRSCKNCKRSRKEDETCS
nr:hypothetical protein [uncultured Treponema sp.]